MTRSVSQSSSFPLRVQLRLIPEGFCKGKVNLTVLEND